MKKRKHPVDKFENYQAKTYDRLMKYSIVYENTLVNNKFTEKCRNWTGYVYGGWGKIAYRGKDIKAYLVSLMIKMGVDTIPKTNEKGEKLIPIHLCENTKCIESTHIVLELESIVYRKTTLKRLMDNSVLGDRPKNLELTEKCRIWTGHQFNGYGQIGYRDKIVGSHKVSLMVKMGLESLPKTNEKGEILETRHLCNNSLCMEPTHLLLGTKAENAEDRSKNGLHKGENHSNVKITEEQAREIKLSKGNGSIRDRSIRFNVPKSTVGAIDSGHNWGYLPFADGSTSEHKIKIERARETERRKILKETPWTDKQWEEANEKLQDPEYVRTNDTISYNNIFCKEWIRNTVNGYGRMSIHGIEPMAHIIACAIGNNNVRPEGLEAAHQCGNSLCVESAHLKFKTPKDNAEDKIEHGTTNSMIPYDQVIEIRELYETGNFFQFELGEMYNTTQTNISHIVTKKSRING